MSAHPAGSAAPITSSQFRWRMTLFLAVAAALNFADRAAMSSSLSAVRADLALSDVALGMLGSFFLWSYAVGSPFAGNLADRWSRSRMVFVSLLAWSIVTAVTGLAANFPMLLSLRLGLGLAECLFFPAAFALIAQYHVETRARAMSLMTVGINSGMVIGGSAAGWLAQHYGWRSGFLVFGTVGILLALCSRPFLPRHHPMLPSPDAALRPSFFAALRVLARVPTYWAMVAESMMSGMGMWIFFSWLPLHLRETYNMSLAAAGFLGTFVLQISVMSGIAVGGWLSDRVAARARHRRVLLYGSAYLAAAPFLLVFLGAPTFGFVAAGIACFSFLRGLGQSNDHPTLCEVVPPQFRSTGIGVMNACGTASGGCGVLVAGFLKREVGLGGVFAGISGAFILAGIIMLFTYARYSRRDFERGISAELGTAR